MLSLITHISSYTLGAQDPVELGPLMEPDPVPFSFSTPGWYFLGGLFLVFVLYYSYISYKKYRRNAYRRKALSQLSELENSNKDSQGSAELNSYLVQLKVVALQSYGRDVVASKAGKEWLSFLDSTGKNTPFTKYDAVISDSIYKEMTPDKESLLEISELTKRWIKTHA